MSTQNQGNADGSNEHIPPSPGAVMDIHGLQGAKQYNGVRAMVLSKLIEEGENTGRYKVLPHCKGSDFLAVKPSNLKPPPAEEFNMFVRDMQPIHRNCLFWPTVSKNPTMAQIYVTDVPGWPASHSEEEQHLKTKYKWIKPKVLSGVMKRGDIKPSFQMYFDTGDRKSPINHVATQIYHNVHERERAIVSLEEGLIRGPCVLLHAPTKTTFFGSHVGNASDISESPDKLFTLHELHGVVYSQVAPDVVNIYGRQQIM